MMDGHFPQHPPEQAGSLAEDEISSLLAWIDDIPLTRPKRNLTRDFSDGVAAAEVLHHFCPKLVDLHNYPPANAVAQKMYNWNTLNQKVFKKLGYHASQELINAIVGCKPGHVEYLLYELRKKIEKYNASRLRFRDTPTSLTPQPSPITTIPPTLLSPTTGAPPQLQPPPSISAAAAATAASTTQPVPPSLAPPGESLQSNVVIGGGEKVGLPELPQKTAGPKGKADSKDLMIKELQETIQILQLKVVKLEQLLVLKDRRIDDLLRLIPGNPTDYFSPTSASGTPAGGAGFVSSGSSSRRESDAAGTPMSASD
ncbi:hypothetical protein HDU96_010996 [Phlyctochytrium bullatum]|nr:hypothetical protein HDU96_010996 [Phlyctochytrium bullatum]